MADPVISALTYTVTDTTIVAVWTTDISADSNLFAGAKAAIDNGVAASGTAHQCIVTGLLPSTVYSCHVVSGATTGSSSNVTTNAAPNRIRVISATLGSNTTTANASDGDTYRTFVSNDDKTYITQDDGHGFIVSTPNAGYNTQLGVLTDEAAMTGTLVSLANYGGVNIKTGTDGPAADAMGNKSTGLFGLNGNLHYFVYRQYPPSYSTNRYCNWIKSTNHGATWNNFTALSTFTAGGNPVTPNSPAEPVQFYDKTIGLVIPILYAADDGTLGYNTAGNQIDGANAYVYLHYFKDAGVGLYLMRIPRIKFDAQDASAIEYWIGPGGSPTAADFVNDSYWTVTEGTETEILIRGLSAGGWGQCIFVPGINSYVFYAHASGFPTGSSFDLYSAPTPAGPWNLYFYQNNSTANQGWYGVFPFHRDFLGNTAINSIATKMLYSGTGPSYMPNWSTQTMLTGGAAAAELASCDFRIVENPLSDGGNFTQAPVFSALKVTAQGVCRATVGSAVACGAYWSSAIPAGDTGGLWPADHYCEVRIQAMITGDAYVMAVRQAAGAETFYAIIGSAVTAIPAALTQTLYAFVAGTPHALSTVNTPIGPYDTMRLAVTTGAHPVLTTSKNGIVIHTFTDTNDYVTAAGHPMFGLIIAGTENGSSSLYSVAAGAAEATVPTFSPAAGSYVGTQTVTVTGPASSTIYYTTDGTTPTRSSSSIASGATISVAASETVKAISSKTNFVDSQINGAAYVISAASTGTGSPGFGINNGIVQRIAPGVNN